MTKTTKDRLLITGFPAFGSHISNPTEKIVKGLDYSKFSPCKAIGMILPVSFDGCIEVINHLSLWNNLRCWIMLGLNPKAESVELERIAINVQDSLLPDNAGIIRMNHTIAEDCPDGVFSSLPLPDLKKALENEGFPCKISNSAGTFVCNTLFYRGMLVARQHGFRAGFVHVPQAERKQDLIHLCRAIECIVQTCLTLC